MQQWYTPQGRSTADEIYNYDKALESVEANAVLVRTLNLVRRFNSRIREGDEVPRRANAPLDFVVGLRERFVAEPKQYLHDEASAMLALASDVATHLQVPSASSHLWRHYL